MTEVYAVFRGSRGSTDDAVLVCVFAREEDADAWCHSAMAACVVGDDYWVEPSPFWSAVPVSE